MVPKAETDAAMQSQSSSRDEPRQDGEVKRIHGLGAANNHESANAEGGWADEDDGSGDPEHTQPCRMGGISMMQLMEDMKKDAVEQEGLVTIISELISETVQRNDSRNVRKRLLRRLHPPPGASFQHAGNNPPPLCRGSPS